MGCFHLLQAYQGTGGQRRQHLAQRAHPGQLQVHSHGGPKDADGNLSFYIWLRNSIILRPSGPTLLGLVMSTTAAYAFSRFNFALKKPGLMMFIIVQMFPGAIIIIPYYNLDAGARHA